MTKIEHLKTLLIEELNLSADEFTLTYVKKASNKVKDKNNYSIFKYERVKIYEIAYYPSNNNINFITVQIDKTREKIYLDKILDIRRRPI